MSDRQEIIKKLEDLVNQAYAVNSCVCLADYVIQKVKEARVEVAEEAISLIQQSLKCQENHNINTLFPEKGMAKIEAFQIINIILENIVKESKQ
ncbi:MAG TPA: hypothetical protein PLZ69_02845 [Candidatus Pacearchaeota archaeon]|nr:hypothetical protein [Candidatus Pacearchaeota archaeon]